MDRRTYFFIFRCAYQLCGSKTGNDGIEYILCIFIKSSLNFVMRMHIIDNDINVVCCVGRVEIQIEKEI